MKKEKKVIPENRAFWLRWVLALVLSVVIGRFFGAWTGNLAVRLPLFAKGGALSFLSGYVSMMVGFLLCFWVSVLFIRVIAKTSFRSFVLGTAHKRHTKENLILLGLYAVGMGLAALMDIPNIILNPLPAEKLLLALAAALLFTWFQTTTEELWFRGIPCRLFGRDDLQSVRGWRRAVLLIVPAGIFMLMHTANPEVTSTSGVDTVFMVLTYFLAGLMFMVVDLEFGSLEGGIWIHWLNNFTAMTLLGYEVSASGATSLLLDTTVESKGMMSFLSVALTWMPIILYLIVRRIRAKRKASAA